MRYHGHQFQHYNADLGDGRGFLFAQMRGEGGKLLDLGTKGSGQTPWSRRGDGRLTLLGGVREVLATRYLEHLGVNTSKTFSLIETGESLERGDEPSPTRSAVLVRLSHSHIRFGTFQRQAYFEKKENLEALTDYCIRHFYPEANTAAEMFVGVVKASADTVASWMAAGFVHGVMNTDNMNITGESFDYGPYRFLPTLQSGLTAAYFDQTGLYAFARQPETMHWNLSQLAQSLSSITHGDVLIDALNDYAGHYRDALRRHVFRRFDITPNETQDDIDFIMTTFRFLENSQTPWPQFWQDWQGGAERKSEAMKGPAQVFYQGEEFEVWYMKLKRFSSKSDRPYTDVAVSLVYEEIEELWDPIAKDDDWSKFESKLATFTQN